MKWFRGFVVAAALVAAAPQGASAQDEGQGQGQGQTPGGQGQTPGGQGQGEGGRGQGQRGQRGRGNRPGLAEQLKEPLSLTDEQVEKVKAIDAELRAERDAQRQQQQGQGGDQGQQQGGRRGRRQRGQQGGQGMQAFREQMEKQRAKTQEKVRAILTPEQNAKYDEYLKKQESQRQSFFGQGGQRGPRNRDLYAEAEKSLVLSDEEKAAVLPLVKKVVEAENESRETVRKGRDGLQAFIKDHKTESDTDQAAIAEKLKEYRHDRDSAEAKVEESRKALREVLTPDNEARLVALGVL